MVEERHLQARLPLSFAFGCVLARKDKSLFGESGTRVLFVELLLWRVPLVCESSNQRAAAHLQCVKHAWQTRSHYINTRTDLLLQRGW